MKVTFRLAQILEPYMKRGLISEIAESTKIERHTVTALVANKAKYISLDAMNALCNYLVNELKVDPSGLPGALFGRDPEEFWQLLAKCEQMEFVLGTRTSDEWPRAAYMMASDARLEALIISALSRYDPGAKTVTHREPQKEGGSRQLLPQFHLVKAPPSGCKMNDAGPEWRDVCREAKDTFERKKGTTGLRAHFLIGSVKVNSVVDLLFARIFDAKAFRNQDQVKHPTDRSCPILFRYRNDDPQPPSCIGGMKLARNVAAPEPGIYFETASGDWQCCPWVENKQDAAFLLYAYDPSRARLDVACGGFSSRATNQLANDLETIASQFGHATYETDSLKVGLYVIQFTAKAPDNSEETANGMKSTPAPAYDQCDIKVHAVPYEALARRLKE